jgi:hypothetical protein
MWILGLTYDYPDKKKACTDEPLVVKYNGSAFGEIRKVKDGYQFFSANKKGGGNVFGSVPEVQHNLLRWQPPKKESPVEEKETDKSAGLIKKVKKELKDVSAKLEEAKVLLTASSELFGMQVTAEKAVNLLEENITCGETEVDGHSLYEDIGRFLENA